MNRTLDYARPRPPESTTRTTASSNYAALPAWVFYVNGVAALLSWGVFAFAFAGGIVAVLLMMLAGYAMLFAHGLFVVMPSLGAIILAERIAPRERLAALGLTLGGFAGTVLCVFGPWALGWL